VLRASLRQKAGNLASNPQVFPAEDRQNFHILIKYIGLALPLRSLRRDLRNGKRLVGGLIAYPNGECRAR